MRAREGQINEMVAAFLRWSGPYKEKETESARAAFSKLASEWVQEAERRTEQRVRAECREEISSLRNTLSKCEALTDELTSPECSLSFLPEDAMEGLRLFVKRIKVEGSRDSARLDWLLSRTHYGIPGFEPVVRGRTPEKRKADLIRAIDTAREVGK